MNDRLFYENGIKVFGIGKAKTNVYLYQRQTIIA